MKKSLENETYLHGDESYEKIAFDRWKYCNSDGSVVQITDKTPKETKNILQEYPISLGL